jgi:hypothetical protein
MNVPPVRLRHKAPEVIIAFCMLVALPFDASVAKDCYRSKVPVLDVHGNPVNSL